MTRVDSPVPLMYMIQTDLGSLIRIRITPKERSLFVNVNFNLLIIKWYDIVAGTHICLSNTKDRVTLRFQRLKNKQRSRFTLQDYRLEGRTTPKVEQHRRTQ